MAQPTPVSPPRPFALPALTAAAVVSGFCSLLAARYLNDQRWIDALWLLGASIGVFAGGACAMVLRRLLGTRWRMASTLVLGAVAALTRSWLLAQLGRTPSTSAQLDFGAIALAAASVACGGLALLWGVSALPGELDRPGRLKPGLHLCAIGVTLALYALTPLWLLLGLRLDHWTVVGLFGLACVAHLLATTGRWLATRGHR